MAVLCIPFSCIFPLGLSGRITGHGGHLDLVSLSGHCTIASLLAVYRVFLVQTSPWLALRIYWLGVGWVVGE